MNYPEIEKRLGYTFRDKKLLKTALTLASADSVNNNQTMEFFGDAILECIVSERIYDDEKSEGELTERRKTYVSDKALTPVSKKLGLDEFFIKARGDYSLKKSIPSAYEAVLAAIYLDGGMDMARAFVYRTLDFSPVTPPTNYKGSLQEFLQGKGEPLPVYERINIGTPQEPVFSARVNVLGKTFEGTADNVKQAEQLAAQKAMLFFTDSNPHKFRDDK